MRLFLDTPGRYFVPGSNFVKRWNGKAAREQRKNGVGLAPKILVSSCTLKRRQMPFSSEMEVILIIDLQAEKEGDPTICFS